MWKKILTRLMNTLLILGSYPLGGYVGWGIAWCFGFYVDSSPWLFLSLILSGAFSWFYLIPLANFFQKMGWIDGHFLSDSSPTRIDAPKRKRIFKERTAKNKARTTSTKSQSQQNRPAPTQKPRYTPTPLSPAQKPLIPAPPPPPNYDPDSSTLFKWPDEDDDGDIKPAVNQGITAENISNPDWRNDNGTETTTRPAQPEVEVNLLHKRMQDEIIKCLLREKVPGRKIYREYKNVDILVHDEDVFTLIEVKTDPNVWKNIRDGVGQLLEYQFILRPYIQHKINKLIIVAPPRPDDSARQYLEYLNATGKLDIEYKQYVPGSLFFHL